MTKRLAVPPTGHDMLKVLEQFRIIIRTIRRHYVAVQRRAGLSGAQLWALSHVANRPGGNVGELASALALHQSTASNLLRELEKRRLITRKRGGSDMRQVQLFATQKGRRVLKGAPQPPIGVLQQALSELPAASLKNLHQELSRVVRLMKGKVLAARATPLSDM